MSSEKFVVFKSCDDFELENLLFRKYKNVYDIRYKKEEDKRSKTIYIQTPTLEVSHIEVDEDNYYFIFNLNDNTEQFWNMISTLDVATLDEMCQNQEEWGYNTGTPAAVIENHYVPTLKMTSITYDYAFTLQVPKTDDIPVFSLKNEPISVEDIKVGDYIKLLLLLDGVENQNQFFSLKLNLEQAKIRPPPKQNTNQNNMDTLENQTNQETILTEKDLQEQPKKDDTSSSSDDSEKPKVSASKCVFNESEDDGVSVFNKETHKYRSKPKKFLYEYDD